MKKIGIGLLGALVVAGFIAYQYFSGREFVYQFPEAQIHEMLSTRMPFEKTYFFIFTVVLDNPRVDLVNGSDRVNAGLDVTLNIKVDNEPEPLGGTIDVSSGLAYSPDEGAFYLVDPVIESLGVQGIPEKYADRTRQVLARAISEYYAVQPVYRIRADDPARAAARLLLKRVVVENQELVVVLGI